mmetsp:Transcript_35198/g.82321  ORF Transcript_35198/g.82321 Transcript_35198/m.82321 type:complete len:108 (-) Transcript_35198:392-715(-)
MPFTHSPRFPPVNSSPSSGAVVANITAGEWFSTCCISLGAGALGFAGGKPLRRQGFWLMASFGLFASFLARCRASEYRLLGYMPNERECNRAGIEFKELRRARFYEP